MCTYLTLTTDVAGSGRENLRAVAEGCADEVLREVRALAG